MVKGSPKNNKWMRRYRTFFVIGIVILSFQIFLAVRFLSISRNVVPQANQWEPSNSENQIQQEVELNWASKRSDVEDNVVSPKTKKNKLNQTYILKYEELEFVPPCEIATKEAVSAINRAKSQNCKQVISNITCLALEGKLYPSALKGSCPVKGYAAGKELGCFKDEKKFRLLNGYFGVNKKENSPKYCLNLCLQSGFPYAGVQYSYECFCGTDEPPLTSKVPDSSCNLKCPRDQHANCGGYYNINIYHTGIKKFIAQTANTVSTNGTGKFVRIVFLLTLNGRAVRQVKRLLKILYNENHYYYIHVDIRQDYLYRELLALEKVLPNVRLTRHRFATIWGGASLLEMLRSCMWELLGLTDWKWDFILNLSESDFPVKTVMQLTQFLSVNQNKNFVKSHGREVQRFIQKQGLDKTFVECEARMWRIGDRRLPNGVQVDGGSDWVALSRKFVEYVANPLPDDLVSGLLQIFKYTLLPAESFFHTVLRNSKFCGTYIDNNLHVTNWKRKLGCKCQYKHVVDWCGCSPNDFRPEDWPRIQSTFSRQLYFARKFEPIINQAVILQLELWLFGLEQPSKNIQNLHSYWQNIYHHNDLGVTPNDGLLTIGNSIKRHLIKILAKYNSSSCDLGLSTLIQVHSFHHNDTYRYSLFNFNASEAYTVEAAVRPLRYTSVSKTSPLMEQLEISVSTDYDQKEQISRNFLRILSPQSEPVLIYRFRSQHSTKVYNMTCLWISPTGSLQDAVEFSIDDSTLSGQVKPTLKQPILPGCWIVKIIYKNSMLEEVKFLVTPLEFYLGIPIKENQASILNGGSKNIKDNKSHFEKFLPKESEQKEWEDASLENSRKHGHSLLEWIDGLFSTFYKVERICVTASNTVDICGIQVSACVNTNWSSFASDPKSAIGTINETTGTFNIW